MNKKDKVPYYGISSGRYGNDYWFSETIDIKNDPGIIINAQHDPRTYMFLLTREKGFDCSYKYSVKRSGAWCPVDLKVYNSAGELVGSITDNVVDDENRTGWVIMTVGGDNQDEKYIYFVIDDTYTIEFTGTDDGVMKYFVQEIDSGDGTVISEKVYEKVGLFDGKQMISKLSVWDNTDTSSGTDRIDVPDVMLFIKDSHTSHTENKPIACYYAACAT